MKNAQSLIDGLLSQLASLLGPLSPFTKAVVPAALALAYAIVNIIVTGTFDASALTAAVGGVLAAVVVYRLPNKPKAVPAPAPVAPVAPPAPKAK